MMKKDWEKQIVDWLHRYIDDVTDLEINKETITLRVNSKIVGLLVLQKIGE
tara:strand:- start:1936 stop:2088 length:153 start_codon:yes stop_codon:yes gene_type:complete